MSLSKANRTGTHHPIVDHGQSRGGPGQGAGGQRGNRAPSVVQRHLAAAAGSWAMGTLWARGVVRAAQH